MAWQYPIWTPERSFKRGFSIFDLYYTQWGNLSTGAGFFPSPAADGGIKLPNFHGVAIGSRSTVDRVQLQTQLVADLTQNRNQGIIPVWVDGRRTIDFASCHIGMPLRGQVLGPVTVANDEAYDNATTYFADDGVGTPRLLVSAAFEHPALHLQLLQRKQDVSLFAGPRMPMMRQDAVAAVATGPEQLWNIYPIAGRRGLTFQAAVEIGSANFRLATIGAAQGGSPLIEKTLGVVSAAAAASTVYIDLTGRAQYLAIYFEPLADPTGFSAAITLTDDCCGESAVQLGGGI